MPNVIYGPTKNQPCNFCSITHLLLSRVYRLTPSLSTSFCREKKQQGESCRRIRLGDLSKANAGWARVVQMEEPYLRNRGQEKNCREQKFFALFCWLQGEGDRRKKAPKCLQVRGRRFRRAFTSSSPSLGPICFCPPGGPRQIGAEHSISRFDKESHPPRLWL